MQPPTPLITSLEELWKKAAAAQQHSYAAHPEIVCRTGCNLCCKGHGSPITYAVEWEPIASFLTQHPEQKAAVKARYLALKSRLKSQMQQENPTLYQALFDTPCPFITSAENDEATAEGKTVTEYCGIYEIRPMTCRVFGNTTLQTPVTSGEAVYACNPEKDRWEETLPMAVDLPSRDAFFAELAATGAPRSLLSFLEAYFYEHP